MSSRDERRPTVLVVEDDRALREGLAMNLRMRGYEVVTAEDGNEGVRLAFDARPDLAILDVMMPGLSGLDIVEELREHGEGVPVLILSALGTVDNKVTGLKLGADDYLGKPFDLAELLARVEALLRRRRRDRDAEPPLQFGDLVIRPQTRQVLLAGAQVHLSAKEFQLLYLLATNPGRVFSRELILRRVWGWDYEGTSRTVDNFVRALRIKVEPDPASPRHIITVRQTGYRFDP